MYLEVSHQSGFEELREAAKNGLVRFTDPVATSDGAVRHEA